MASLPYYGIGEYRIMTNENYFNDLIILFPLLKPMVMEEDPEMLHCHMERFADYTIEQIEKDNVVELKKCFDFQETNIGSMSSDLQNALVSVLIKWSQ
jgi:hypothetical protein